MNSKTDNLEKTLIENANNSRYTKNQAEVISLYKQILNRPSAPIEYKIEAIINASAYLFSDRGLFEDTFHLMDEYYSVFCDQPVFIRQYSSFLWSKNKRDKAVQILNDYLLLENDINSDIDIELVGVLATKRALYLIDKRDELKNKKNYNEIKDVSYSDEWNKQRHDFYGYINHTWKQLMSTVINSDLRKISPSARQNLFTGVYHAIEVFNRVQKYDEILHYKDVLLRKFSGEHQLKLSDKLKRVYYYSQKN